MKFFYYILILFYLVTSCGESEVLSPIEYVKWVENPSNGLVTEKEAGGFMFKLQYKPIEYIIAVQERKKQLPKEVFENTKSKMEDLQYFTLRISPYDEDKPLLDKATMTGEEYDQRVHYFAFGLQHDLVLIDGQDSLKCLLFHYERAYNLSTENTFLLGFDQSKESSLNETKKLIYQDDILGIGTVGLAIDKAALSNIPEIKLN